MADWHQLCFAWQDGVERCRRIIREFWTLIDPCLSTKECIMLMGMIPMRQAGVLVPCVLHQVRGVTPSLEHHACGDDPHAPHMFGIKGVELSRDQGLMVIAASWW